MQVVAGAAAPTTPPAARAEAPEPEPEPAVAAGYDAGHEEADDSGAESLICSESDGAGSENSWEEVAAAPPAAKGGGRGGGKIAPTFPARLGRKKWDD